MKKKVKRILARWGVIADKGTVAYDMYVELCDLTEQERIKAKIEEVEDWDKVQKGIMADYDKGETGLRKMLFKDRIKQLKSELK